MNWYGESEVVVPTSPGPKYLNILTWVAASFIYYRYYRMTYRQTCLLLCISYDTKRSICSTVKYFTTDSLQVWYQLRQSWHTNCLLGASSALNCEVTAPVPQALWVGMSYSTDLDTNTISRTVWHNYTGCCFNIILFTESD